MIILYEGSISIIMIDFSDTESIGFFCLFFWHLETLNLIGAKSFQFYFIIFFHFMSFYLFYLILFYSILFHYIVSILFFSLLFSGHLYRRRQHVPAAEGTLRQQSAPDHSKVIFLYSSLIIVLHTFAHN